MGRTARWACPGPVLLASLQLAAGANLSQTLRADRDRALGHWRRGEGLLWFQHFRRAGGTSLCHLLRAAAPSARFLLSRGEACQPESWKLRDAAAVCGHNFSLLAAELRVLEGNAFAQEYGSLPGPRLMGHRSQRWALRHWVIIFSLRDPWSRLWSQLRYELATCLVNAKTLAVCIAGQFERLGDWWSPTAHRDSVLGVPGATLAPGPEVYVDNYYTRVLLNRTDVSGPPLTDADLQDALMLLTHRVSAVVIVEDFARSALQLACVLGLDLEEARPLLRTRVRPYEAMEALLADVPKDESQLGEEDVRKLRERFAYKNRYDFTLYAYAQMLAKRRLAECSQRNPMVKAWRNLPPDELVEVAPPPSPPEPSSIDDMFGCNGGTLFWSEEAQSYLLKCPRTAKQHATSWWTSKAMEGEPVRKLGEKPLGADCWNDDFSWAACCQLHFGPEGNTECWDDEFNYTRCCTPAGK